ncbi:WD domain, G-beta repeat protein [Necator americanus]|uniref:WD repeat-containing protein 44 n=1 Tax=Necator americanus TaxID=51031 RepID=W2SFB8_NECAM|nr:WD domain, G-beta repeat protein [Necator americanus]ETN68223.1 WD domain, G-beta repeat protein [Necator americanus]
MACRLKELSNEHTGAVWCVRFSVCGRLMATAGQDNIIRVWAALSHLRYFIQIRERYQQRTSNVSASSSQEFQSSFHNGHTADILDLSWSKNYFILSCGMDRTVKLWHLSRNECLCCFQHVDFVTSVAFLPKKNASSHLPTMSNGDAVLAFKAGNQSLFNSKILFGMQWRDAVTIVYLHGCLSMRVSLARIPINWPEK